MELYDRRNAPKRHDTWFVYGLVDSRSPSEIRYIGITVFPRRRLQHHVNPKCGRSSHWRSRWAAKVLREGGDVLMGIIISGATEDHAKREEMRLIAEHRALNSRLVNVTAGGNGLLGYRASPETRRKIGAAHAGKKISAEHRAILIEHARNPSEDTRRKMSLSQLGRRHSAETLAKMSENNAMRRPEEREKVRASLLGIRRSEEQRRRQSIAARNRTAAHNEKIGLANRLRPPRGIFKGVSFNKALGKWKVAIRLGNTRPHLGYFHTAEDAAKAYDDAAFSAWGTRCYLNFPERFAAAA